MKLALGLSIIVLFLAQKGLGMTIKDEEKPIKKVEWSDRPEPIFRSLGAKVKKIKAYRDVVTEKTVRRVFDKFMAKVRQPKLYGRQIIRDPLFFGDGFYLNKRTSAYTFDMRTSHIMLHGLKDLKMTNVQVSRHYKLQDIKANVTVMSDLKFEGQYNLKGMAMGIMPISGKGYFTINVKGFRIQAISYLALDDTKKNDKDLQKLVVRNLDVHIDYDNIHFDFQNLMGGGIIGASANAAINVMGDAIIQNEKTLIIKILKENYHAIIETLF